MQEREISNNFIRNNLSLKDVNLYFSNQLLSIGVASISGSARVFPSLMTGKLLKLFSTPLKKSKIISDFVESSQVEAITFEGLKISSYVFGNDGNPKVLLIHGWARSASDFREFIPKLLEAGYQVIAVDLPAHGNSQGSTTNAIQVTRLVEGLYGQYGQFEAVIGHSFGGFAAARAISDINNLTKKLVTIGSPNTLNGVLDSFSRKLKLSPRTKRKFRSEVEKKFDISIKDQNIDNYIKVEGLKSLIVHDIGDRQVKYTSATDITNNVESAQLLQTRQLGHNRILRNEEIINKIVTFCKE